MTIRTFLKYLTPALAFGALLLTSCTQLEQLREKTVGSVSGPAIEGSAETGFTAAETNATAIEARTHAVIAFINDVYLGDDRTIFVDPELIPLLNAYYETGQVDLAAVDQAAFGAQGQVVDSTGRRGVLILAEALEVGPNSATIKLTEQTNEVDMVSWQRQYVLQTNGDWVAARSQ